jgi:hypothetical protein
MSPYEDPVLSTFMSYLTFAAWSAYLIVNILLARFIQAHPASMVSRFAVSEVIKTNPLLLLRYKDLQGVNEISAASYSAAILTGPPFLFVMLAASIFVYCVIFVRPSRYPRPTLSTLKGIGLLSAFWSVIIFFDYIYNAGLSNEKFPSMSMVFAYPYFCFMGFSGVYATWAIAMQILALLLKIVNLKLQK